MTEIRAYRPTDRSAVASICTRTGDSGADATGHFSTDELLPDVYALPYVVHEPELALLVDAGAGPIGYILGTADTVAFDQWFVERWWPTVVGKYEEAASSGAASEQERGIVRSATERIGLAPELLAQYPAHLHIDLLPETQGMGLGRRLIDAFCGLLAERGVPGVHLGVGVSNTGAQRFYERTGFTRVDGDPGAHWYAKAL
ncbi:GNAT family N-acetyltransferase [Plantibacter sp. VKM Ac-2880]|uniref:GNAT family N-acetyltransferase n=1 Tax=Plantibacter sp. VKM Ac-2880 TaxID=2783827 RepID=UPI0018905F47|nr:GNAT family N-acetyltransferase [Plantibacter sp. VKM Ac-2880]